MLLLMSPFIALTGILKWSEEKQIFAVNTIKKYLGLVGVILLGMSISLLADYIAYSGSDWREFRDFFDARTKVYDYTWYPEYEEAEQFYQGIGVTPAKITLIDNYNFGLDESIDSRMLWDIAEYAEATGVKTPLVQRLKEAFIDYKWRSFHEQDAGCLRDLQRTLCWKGDPALLGKAVVDVALPDVNTNTGCSQTISAELVPYILCQLQHHLPHLLRCLEILPAGDAVADAFDAALVVDRHDR